MAAEPYFVIVAHGRHRLPELVCFQEDGPPGLFDTDIEAAAVAVKLKKREPRVNFTVLKLED